MKFTEYPALIDPASNVLTLKAGPQGRWSHLHRVVLLTADLPHLVNNDVTHAFGPATCQQDCPFLLCYNTDGRLTTILERSGSSWSRYTVAEELSGRVECLPSVRFVFQNESDRGRFMQLLQKLGESVRKLELPSPQDAWELTTLILRQPHPPRLVPVAVEPVTNERPA
jgi:hypothetical protein